MILNDPQIAKAVADIKALINGGGNLDHHQKLSAYLEINDSEARALMLILVLLVDGLGSGASNNTNLLNILNATSAIHPEPAP